jgi:hypothetical protein
MLHQYLMSKVYIARMLVALDFDDDMIQDAMAIILLPPPDKRGHYSKILRRHYARWLENRLPNPLKTRHGSLIDEVHRLQARLLLFIEDYLTKATAIFPPREYVCLPDLSPKGTHLMFKDEAVSSRFNATQLTDAERKRLLTAFLRYEMMCAIRRQRTSSTTRWNFRHPIAGFVTEWDLGSSYEYRGQRLGPSERETILCVHQYVKSLYAAMFAQCSDSWLPDIPVGSLYSYSTGLLYPDTLYVNACAYASDMGLKSVEASHPISIEAAGFDLVTVLVRSATAGQDGRDRLRCWFKSFFQDTRMNVRSSVPSLHGMYDEFERGEARDAPYEEGSGMYQMLCSRVTADFSLHSDIYRQRAWAFFDDDRFYASSGAGPHFPDRMDMGEQWGSTEDGVEWFSDPKHARARHRSQKWHHELLGKLCGDEEVKEFQDLKVDTLLPATSERYWFRRLPRFWR